MIEILPLFLPLAVALPISSVVSIAMPRQRHHLTRHPLRHPEAARLPLPAAGRASGKCRRGDGRGDEKSWSRGQLSSASWPERDVLFFSIVVGPAGTEGKLTSSVRGKAGREMKKPPGEGPIPPGGPSLWNTQP
jgi:hypothetical protein